MGKTLGDDSDPLLVSVRSGSPFSMPGMMDTVLNLGLNDVSIQGLIAQTGNERFAWDCYRRFIQMFSKVVLDVEGDSRSRTPSRSMKHDARREGRHRPDRRRPQAARRGVQGRSSPSTSPPTSSRSSSVPTAGSCSRRTSTTQLQPLDRGRLPQLDERSRGRLPQDGEDRRRPRHRGQHPDDGLRQQGRDLGDGRRRSRATRPTAPTSIYGDFLTNAQGEDVVAGIRNTQPHRGPQDTSGPREAGAELWEVFDDAREPLPRHVRHRVHDRAGQAVDAADAHRQAHRARRAQDRRRHGRARA